MIKKPAYTYNAVVVRWVDGDTVHIAVDVGFFITSAIVVRLFGIDTPERGQSGYQEAKDRVNELAPVGTSVVVQTYKDADKYGRFLAEIGTVNTTLVEEGLARTYLGGKK